MSYPMSKSASWIRLPDLIHQLMNCRNQASGFNNLGKGLGLGDRCGGDSLELPADKDTAPGGSLLIDAA